MAASRGTATRLRQSGLGTLTPEQVTEALQLLLETEASCEFGVVPIDWSRWQQQRGLSFYAQFASDLPSEVIDIKATSAFLDQLKAAAVSERPALLEAYLKTQVAKVLGWSEASTINSQQSLFELGLDSLMAVELRNQFQSGLGLTTIPTLLFEYPTVAALTHYFLETVDTSNNQSNITGTQEIYIQESSSCLFK